MDQKIYAGYVNILKTELVPAMGCTEPIALAYAASRAREHMTCDPERIVARCSGNMIKKAKIANFATSRHWNHPTTFIRAEVYKNNPYSLISMYDDFELILRLRKQGVKMAVENKVLANFVFGGMSTKKDFKDTLRRIKLSCNNYKINGYGLPYFIDRVVIEMAKFILG